jgi:hypothetical protein
MLQRATTITAVMVALVACGGPRFIPVADPAVRVEYPGFSVLPPPGEGWTVVRGPSFVVFRKQLGSKTHSLGAMIGIHTGVRPDRFGFAEYKVDPEVFAALAKFSTQQMNPPGGRMRFLEHTTMPDDRFGYCVREYARMEDRGSPLSSSAKEGFLLQEDQGYECLHPDSSRVIVQMMVSERGLPGESDPTVKQIRERFFAGFQFRKLARVE